MRLTFLCLLLALLAGPAWAQQPRPAAPPAGIAFEEEARPLRVRIDGRPVQLEALAVRRKDLGGRLPVALITHGSNTDRGRRAEIRAETMRAQARDLARRGWLAIAVVRRGYGASDGPGAPDMACPDLKIGERFAAEAKDLRAALDEALKRPDADPERAIVIGFSGGGGIALALAASAPPPALKAVVNIAGGLRAAECAPASEAGLVRAITELAPRVKAPSLWVYADNDRMFGPQLVDRMLEAARQGGMDVRRVAVPSIGEDGHSIFNSASGRRAWLQELDQSLRAWSLPAPDRNVANAWARALDLDPPASRRASTATRARRLQGDGAGQGERARLPAFRGGKPAGR